MHKQGKGRHIKGKALGLARPVEKRLAQNGKLLYGVLKAAHSRPDAAVVQLQLSRCLEAVRGCESRGVADAGQ